MCTNGIFCGWHFVFCLMWHTAASTFGSTCFLCKQVSLVWQPWRRLWWHSPATVLIGTASRFARGAAHVWRYVLTTVGPERIYVCMEPPSTTHAGDWMFIAPEVVDGRLWHVAYEGRAVRLFQMRRASTSWRSVLQSFALQPRFGRLECTSGRQMMCQAEPPTQTR